MNYFSSLSLEKEVYGCMSCILCRITSLPPPWLAVSVSVILMVQNIGPLQNEASLWKKI